MSEFSVVTIDAEEYERLTDAGLLLGALKTAGIEKWDNWEIAAGLFAKAKGIEVTPSE